MCILFKSQEFAQPSRLSDTSSCHEMCLTTDSHSDRDGVTVLELLLLSSHKKSGYWRWKMRLCMLYRERARKYWTYCWCVKPYLFLHFLFGPTVVDPWLVLDCTHWTRPFFFQCLPCVSCFACQWTEVPMYTVMVIPLCNIAFLYLVAVAQIIQQYTLLDVVGGSNFSTVIIWWFTTRHGIVFFGWETNSPASHSLEAQFGTTWHKQKMKGDVFIHKKTNKQLLYHMCIVNLWDINIHPF